MAEKGAHLTGTTLIRPSIFEIIAQESFASTVEPAFKKIFSYIVSFNIERYGHLLRWADESYLIFNTILQRYYLDKYSASFSEVFYSLKRVAVTGSKGGKRLSDRQKKLSLILIVLFPYVKNKLLQQSQQYQLENKDGYAQKSTWQKLYRKCFIEGNKIFFMTYEFLVLYNYISYISEKSVYTSPLLRSLFITLTYAEPHPTITVSDLLQKIQSNSFGLNDGIDILQRAVTTSLQFGAFFLQFLSWWSQENSSMNLMSLPIPPPPKISEGAKQYKGICPICRKAVRVHTVLPISGYAFCYQCIIPAIREHGRCPVTNYPAKEDDLIRLYLQ